VRIGNEPGGVPIFKGLRIRIRQQAVASGSSTGHSRFNLIKSARSQKQVHLGQGFGDRFPITFRQTPDHDQFLANAGDFMVSKGQDGINGFIGSRLNKAAGIDNNHMGPFRIAGNAPSTAF